MPTPAAPNRRRLAKALLPAALLAALAAVPAPRAAEGMRGVMNRSHDVTVAPEAVDEVLAAAVYIMKGQTLQLRVDAAGRTSHPGHTAGILIPHLTFEPPANGIYEMTFETFPSRGGQPQAPDRIEVINLWKTFPPDLVGLRIYGARNCVEVFIEERYQNLKTGHCVVAAQ